MRVSKPSEIIMYAIFGTAWIVVMMMMFVNSSLNVGGLIVLVVLSVACTESFFYIMYGRRWFRVILYLGSVIFGCCVINIYTSYSFTTFVFLANALLAALFFSVPLGYLLSISVVFKNIFIILTDDYMKIVPISKGEYCIQSLDGTTFLQSGKDSYPMHTKNAMFAFKFGSIKEALEKAFDLGINVMPE